MEVIASELSHWGAHAPYEDTCTLTCDMRTPLPRNVVCVWPVSVRWPLDVNQYPCGLNLRSCFIFAIRALSASNCSLSLANCSRFFSCCWADEERVDRARMAAPTPVPIHLSNMCCHACTAASYCGAVGVYGIAVDAPFDRHAAHAHAPAGNDRN